MSLVVFCIGLASTAIAAGADASFLLQMRQLVPPGEYLILFQNNAELRPSGGFLGSFATVKIAEWGYEDVAIDTNIYKRDNAFTARHSIEPPLPLKPHIADGKWAMRDSNWDLDFRDAAERVAWFYQQEGGTSVDGVIAVNATVLVDLLNLTGPIELPRSGEIVDSDTVLDALHHQIERSYFDDPERAQENEPKEVLTELLPILEERLRQPVLAWQAVKLVRQELNEKHIQLYHVNSSVESKILKAGWGGEIVSAEGGYLAVNQANVGAKKSSLSIQQSLALSVTTSGEVHEHVLEIQRTHAGTSRWPDGPDVSYLRILLPESTQVRSFSIDGVEISYDQANASGKVVVGTSVTTRPGQTAALRLAYDVSRTLLGQPYQLTYQKQSGVLREFLSVYVDGKDLFQGAVVRDTFIGREGSFPLHD